MNYGLYLSANGVLANSFRQDVIANNLANVENVGFKRDVSTFQQRLTEAQLDRARTRGASNPLLDDMSGGMLLSPLSIDLTQGEFEKTGNNLDLALQGDGYFAVQDGKETRLTRDGRLMIDRQGHLVLANGSGNMLLDRAQKPIRLDPAQGTSITIGQAGEINQAGKIVAQLGVFNVSQPEKLQKHGRSLLTYAGNGGLRPSNAMVRSEFVERANVDPATELTQLMDAQRQLEANANMIRYQDQTMARLVNDVGKIT